MGTNWSLFYVEQVQLKDNVLHILKKTLGLVLVL